MESRLSSFEFDNAKVSAFYKYVTIDPEEFRYVTLGPNSVYKNEYSDSCDEISKPRSFKIGQFGPRSRQKTGDKPEGEVEDEVKVPQVDKEDEGLPIREIIKDLETESLKEAVQSAVQKRLDNFNKHHATLEYQSKNRLLLRQQKLIENIRHEEEKIIDMLVETDANNSCEREKRTKYYQHLAEDRRKNIAELVAKEKLRQELNRNIDKTTKIHKEFTATYIEIANCIKASQVTDELKIPLGEEVKYLKSLLADMDEVTEKCKSPNYNSSDVQKAAEILNRMKVMKERIQSIINYHISKEKNEPAKPNEDTQLINAKTEPVSVSVIHPTTSHKESVKTMTDVTLEKYISRENLRLYSQIQDFLSKYTESFKELSENPSLKQFIFDCKKAVNIPVNALTAVNPYHLRDKYERLYNLLSGKQVEIANNKYLVASKHPQGVSFCVDLLAKKMVLQADLMISSKADSAFCYATIIVALWNVIPEFGKLFLGYLYKGCPYLVPFNVVKSVDQSPEEFYMSQGYQYSDGQIEKQDKYLKRMTGMMRLYSAVIITKPKSGHVHPHGIENGWRWLASILKLEPQLDITATMLHTFLEIAGYQMQMVYRKAFKKLIQVIILKFMPIMKENDSGGPATRLEGLLQKYQQTGQFEEPYGILPDKFW